MSYCGELNGYRVSFLHFHLFDVIPDDVMLLLQLAVASFNITLVCVPVLEIAHCSSDPQIVSDAAAPESLQLQ